MSADRFEISDHGSKLTVRDTKYGSEVSMLRVRSYSRELTVMAGAIRQQARDITELKVEARTLGYRAKTLDMLALRILGDEESEDFVKDELDNLQQPSDWLPFESPAYVIAQCIDERDQLRTDLAAAVSENAALLAANRDLKAHFDALKGDHDEAAHFGRHFIRDDPNITPRGAIIRLGDKCTDLFCRLQSAEQDRDTLRARLAAIDNAPTVAVVCSSHSFGKFVQQRFFGSQLPRIGTELIARPAKD